jgi:diguanylate cyclase (GGDEF)-like protein
MRLTTGTVRFALPVARSPRWAAAVIIGMLLVIFLIDRRTGTAPVQHLYYLPIILAGNRFTLRGGIAGALAAVTLYHVANPQLLSLHYGESDAVQVALFLAVGIVTAKLTSDNRRLHQLAITDDLTGLHNLRSFEASLARMVRAAEQAGSPLALLVADLDRLKSLNDEYGHLTGAEGVRMVGQIIGRCLPPDAVACRYGGDEFAIAIPNCSEVQARHVAHDLCEAVRASVPTLAGRVFPAATLTISVGVASTSSADRRWGELPTDDAEAGEWLFKHADRALYVAKTAGRDRVSVASREAAHLNSRASTEEMKSID